MGADTVCPRGAVQAQHPWVDIGKREVLGSWDTGLISVPRTRCPPGLPGTPSPLLLADPLPLSSPFPCRLANKLYLLSNSPSAAASIAASGSSLHLGAIRAAESMWLCESQPPDSWAWRPPEPGP